jgi:protein phosphatase
LLIGGDIDMLFCGKSDLGMKRSLNEDNFYISELCANLLLCVICDGMGGANGGEVASMLAVSTFADYIKENLAPYIIEGDGGARYDASVSKVNHEELLSAAASQTNDAVRKRSNADSTLEGMGTTLIAALFVNRTVYAVNVGDSRLYHINNGALIQKTHDHSYIQYLIDIGQITHEEAAVSPYRNIITRAIGAESSLKSDTYMFDFDSGFVLMCSDGLYNFTEDKYITEIINKVTDYDSLQNTVNKMIDNANLNGGRDNITIIIVKAETS